MSNKEKQTQTHEIIEKNIFNCTEWQKNITTLDLCNKEISNFDDSVKLPPNLIVLNLSNNELGEVPTAVLKLEYLKTLDLSFNAIVLFDEIPNCCHTLESLNLCNNQLRRPPYWIWTEQPRNLVNLKLSNNIYLWEFCDNDFIEELLLYTTLLKSIDLYNCKLGKFKKLLSTFKYATVLNLGHEDFNHSSQNNLENVPGRGLEECCDIEVLNLCNTTIYNIQSNIDLFTHLKELNLSQNSITSLPNEFCNLDNLEICDLSFNKILYLPDNMHRLSKLVKLYLGYNELCMLPETMELRNLRTLDLYNNHLYEGLDDLSQLEEYDFAQNYNDEPNSDEYLERKRKLRQTYSNRLDGRAPEIVNNEKDYYSSDEFGEEEELNDLEPQATMDSRCVTPEDWDSDDYWVPHHADYSYQMQKRSNPMSTQWLLFVKKKMSEGNFCPIDMHLPISISEKVAYEKKLNAEPMYESDGQFDDYSDDDT